jgi:hypothetical protein
MEAAVLQPTRRPARSLMGACVLLTCVALVWPAAISAAASTTSAAAASASVISDARSARTATVAGRGIKEFGVSHGPPPKEKQQLKIDRTRRGLTGSSGREPRADIAAAAAPTQAVDSGAPAATSFGAWEGFDRAGAAGVCPSGAPCPGPLLEPPDPWVAVGPDDVIQTVNTDIRFTNREGTPTAAAQDAYTFFDLGNVVVDSTTYTIHGYGDPRWLYDQKHNRWLGLLMGWHCDTDGTGPVPGPVGFMFGAISLTGDPTGDYYQYVVAEPDFLHDYPMIGTSGDKFTLASNDYELLTTADCTNGATNAGASLTTFDWAQMLTSPASPVTDIYFYETTPADPNFYFSPRPAVSPQGMSNTIYGVLEVEASPTTSDVQYFTITGSVMSLAGTAVTNVNLGTAGVVSPFADPPAPVQPGGALPSNIIDRRPTDAIWQSNVLTFASTYPCDPVGGGAETRDCARVTQLNTSTGTPSLVQDMLIATSGKDSWYPGIGQSQSGTLHVVYTQSSSTEAMSSVDRYQLPSDAVNTLSTPVETADGGATHYNGVRWGDFVGVAQDPRDRNAVWQGNQYTKSDGTWGTRVSELQTAGSTFVPITPFRVLSSRDGIGLSGFFNSNIARSIQIAGVNNIPANAVAITGNLTVTQQSSAGFLAITPTPNNNPSTSTLNFPLGDNRANNVTSPLGTDGKASIVYRTSVAGKRAHVILDVTGYFIDSASGATYKTMTPTRILDTRASSQVGPFNTPFRHGIVRSWPVRGLNGVAADAIAVTGNVTVAQQTSRGLVAIGPTVAPAPQTSTLNFPLGDNRANGLTVKLAPDGSLSAVFNGTTSTSTAHVIFDVTGFYVQDLTGARFVALTPGRRMDTRVAAPQEGLSGRFSVNVPRTLVVEPYQGVPVNATAITGNLTVTNQTRGGFITMTTDPSSNTSTLNFPIGDTRANGVTGPLTVNGEEIFIYRATASGTTHLILDLTGYFR